jgi:hypothetical protein
MKKNLYIFAILLTAMTTHGQVTLENTYSSPNGIIKMINLSVSGYKYCLTDYITNQVKLYDLNHSLWKTINLPVSAGGNLEHNSIVVSEHLFNSDNSIEVLYPVSFYVSSLSQYDSIFVVSESGIILFNSKAAWSTTYGQIVNDGANFKLITQDYTLTQYNVYSLPGTLPCNACGVFTDIALQNSTDNKQMISNPFPNPTNDKTTIKYELPKGVSQGKLMFYDINGSLVKEFLIDRTFNELQVSNSDLSSGTYYYQLQTIKGTSEGKKLIVIK